VVICLLIVGLAYSGACIYANFIQRDPGEYILPPIKKAQYEVAIRNTRNIIYTDDYDIEGTTYILNGYWELTGDKYKFRDHLISLDQEIFGKITVRSR
jgi:hypothetical protein